MRDKASLERFGIAMVCRCRRVLGCAFLATDEDASNGVLRDGGRPDLQAEFSGKVGEEVKFGEGGHRERVGT